MSVCDKSSCCGGPTRTVKDEEGEEFEECLICGGECQRRNPETERDR